MKGLELNFQQSNSTEHPGLQKWDSRPADCSSKANQGFQMVGLWCKGTQKPSLLFTWSRSGQFLVTPSYFGTKIWQGSKSRRIKGGMTRQLIHFRLGICAAWKRSWTTSATIQSTIRWPKPFGIPVVSSCTYSLGHYSWTETYSKTASCKEPYSRYRPTSREISSQHTRAERWSHRAFRSKACHLFQELQSPIRYFFEPDRLFGGDVPPNIVEVGLEDFRYSRPPPKRERITWFLPTATQRKSVYLAIQRALRR
jgi:hypothetical protein